MIVSRTRVKVVKNKLAPPFKEAEFDIMFGEGISTIGDILDLAVKFGIINKSGAWYAYNGDKIGQGRENAKQFLKNNPDICEVVDHAVREKCFSEEEEEKTEEAEVDETEEESVEE